MWLHVGTILFETILFYKEVEVGNCFNIISEWENELVDDNKN